MITWKQKLNFSNVKINKLKKMKKGVSMYFFKEILYFMKDALH